MQAATISMHLLSYITLSEPHTGRTSSGHAFLIRHPLFLKLDRSLPFLRREKRPLRPCFLLRYPPFALILWRSLVRYFVSATSAETPASSTFWSTSISVMCDSWWWCRLEWRTFALGSTGMACISGLAPNFLIASSWNIFFGRNLFVLWGRRWKGLISLSSGVICRYHGWCTGFCGCPRLWGIFGAGTTADLLLKAVLSTGTSRTCVRLWWWFPRCGKRTDDTTEK